MKQKSLLISCYATLILAGGLIGYFVANSIISLVVSSCFAFFLLCCSALMWKGYVTAYVASLWTVFSLFLFFCTRYLIAFKFFPSGIMALISALLLFYLVLNKSKVCACSQTLESVSHLK